MFRNPNQKCLKYLTECVSNKNVEVDEISKIVLNIEIWKNSKWVLVKNDQIAYYVQEKSSFHNKQEKPPTLPISQIV